MLFPPPPPPVPQKQTIPVSLDQIVISKSSVINSEKTDDPDIENSSRRVRKPILPELHPQRTHPLIWCCAILCLIFSLILILFGVATLIIFVSIKPRLPAFDTPNASLNGIYFDSPEYFNGDFIFLANFSNPNSENWCKIRVSGYRALLLWQAHFNSSCSTFHSEKKRSSSRSSSFHIELSVFATESWCGTTKASFKQSG